MNVFFVDLLLEDFEVRPEDVSHEGGSPGKELVLGDGTDLPARHGEAGHEGVDVGTLQAELPDRPRQPGGHMLLAPKSRIPRNSKTFPICVPRSVRCP